MKYYNSDIVFQEIPDETTLAINISGCPNRCEGCHSKWLWEDVGMPLCEDSGHDIDGDERLPDFGGLDEAVGKYARNISCVCFMGGDQSPETIDLMALRIKRLWPKLKTGWYSGRPAVQDDMVAASEAAETSGTSGASEAAGKTLYAALQAQLPEINIGDFDFIKLGPYIASLGGLRSKTTNQRIYRIHDGKAEIIHIHDPHDFGAK